MTMKMDQDQPSGKTDTSIHALIFKVLALLIVVGGVLIGLHICVSAPDKVAKGAVDTAAGLSKVALDTMRGAGDVLTQYLGAKDAFDATFGPIVKEDRFRRLQFFQRNQIGLFRVLSYRGQDYGMHDYFESYKMEADKRDMSNMILLKQYTEWQAKGTFEFNFYVDMSDLARWNHKWDPVNYSLTLYPPDIEANTPAELEAVTYTKIADSISINEKTTREKLAKAIPRLKVKLANEQKRFMYNEARMAIVDHYQQFLKLIPGLEIEKLPEIAVVFPHEVKLDKSKL